MILRKSSITCLQSVPDLAVPAEMSMHNDTTVYCSVYFSGRDLKTLAEKLKGIGAKIVSLDGALLSSFCYEKKKSYIFSTLK